MAGLGSFPARPLHGDAGAGNLTATGSGWVWHDFEDTCSGPLAWDVAASTVWYNLYAERLPELRPRAAELLALWPAP